ncbi:hypothetical protein HJFPF1_13178 [Paramyrothecium foliicola]|nr:hypothetical protein HJFPF1_13178 [Paramyrothecium foliicola]
MSQQAATASTASNTPSSIPVSSPSSVTPIPLVPIPSQPLAHGAAPLPSASLQPPPPIANSPSPVPGQGASASANSTPPAGHASLKVVPAHAALTDDLFWFAISAMALVIFTALITWRSEFLDWPLANLSAPRSILLLTVLAKFTDWALVSLGEVGWEKLCWGPFLQRGGNLLNHLILTSGLGGSWSVLRNSPQQASPSQSRIINFLTRYFVLRGPRFWAFWRIVIWLLIQFPGVIIMSSADTQNAYEPAGWSTVSGGVGIFNASDAFQWPGDLITNSYIFNILQDRTMAFETEPLNAECRSQSTCEAMLLVGGLKWIAPWPYGWLSNGDLKAYLTRDMPVYQIEGRNTTFDKSLSWTTAECRVYQAADNAVQICAKNSNTDGSIVTGIRACDPGQLDDEGNCTLNPVWPGWNSFVAFSSTLDFYRLNISLAADRRSSTILEIMDKGKATRQVIQPSDFLDAFDNLLCPYTSRNSSISLYCEFGQTRAILTVNLWSTIYMSYNVDALENSAAVDTLRNLYATAIFMYNPVFRGAVLSSGSVFSRPAQDGLADENYFPGSAARASSYIAPANWTVIAFTVSGGFFLCASLAAVSFALWYKQPQISDFEPLNILKVELIQPAQAGNADLETLTKQRSDKELLRAAEGIRIKLKSN